MSGVDSRSLLRKQARAGSQAAPDFAQVEVKTLISDIEEGSVVYCRWGWVCRTGKSDQSTKP